MEEKGYCSPWVLGVVNISHPTNPRITFLDPLWHQLLSWNCFQYTRGNMDTDVDRL